MYSSEQIRAYLLWLRERGLHIPVINEVSPTSMASSDGENPAEWVGPIKVIFLSDLPLASHAQQSDPPSGTDFEQKNLLDRMILAMQLKPEECYITAAFPQDSKATDLADKSFIAAQRLKLKELIKKRTPCLLIALGEQAGKVAFQDYSSFLHHRGKILASVDLDGLAVLSTLHPRDLIRFPGNKRLAWTDLQLGMQHLGHAS